MFAVHQALLNGDRARLAQLMPVLQLDDDRLEYLQLIASAIQPADVPILRRHPMIAEWLSLHCEQLGNWAAHIEFMDLDRRDAATARHIDVIMRTAPREHVFALLDRIRAQASEWLRNSMLTLYRVRPQWARDYNHRDARAALLSNNPLDLLPAESFVASWILPRLRRVDLWALGWVDARTLYRFHRKFQFPLVDLALTVRTNYFNRPDQMRVVLTWPEARQMLTYDWLYASIRSMTGEVLAVLCSFLRPRAKCFWFANRADQLDVLYQYLLVPYNHKYAHVMIQLVKQGLRFEAHHQDMYDFVRYRHESTSVFHHASSVRQLELYQYHGRLSDVEVKRLGDQRAGDYLETALFRAVRLGLDDVAQWWIRKGANTNKRDRRGDTMLHVCRSVEMAMSLACNVNGRNRRGFTPLDRQTYADRTDMVQYLLDMGATAHPNVLGRAQSVEAMDALIDAGYRPDRVYRRRSAWDLLLHRPRLMLYALTRFPLRVRPWTFCTNTSLFGYLPYAAELMLELGARIPARKFKRNCRLIIKRCNRPDMIRALTQLGLTSSRGLSRYYQDEMLDERRRACAALTHLPPELADLVGAYIAPWKNEAPCI